MISKKWNIFFQGSVRVGLSNEIVKLPLAGEGKWWAPKHFCGWLSGFSTPQELDPPNHCWFGPLQLQTLNVMTVVTVNLIQHSQPICRILQKFTWGCDFSISFQNFIPQPLEPRNQFFPADAPSSRSQQYCHDNCGGHNNGSLVDSVQNAERLVRTGKFSINSQSKENISKNCSVV